MNDDSTSTTAAAPRPDIENDTSSEETSESSGEETPQARMRKRALKQTRRKADFIHDIMYNLDILIYAEICVLYYME